MSTLIHFVVEEALKLDIDGMKSAELILARLNDYSEHAFQDELNRLRRGSDAKIEAQTLQHPVMLVNTHGGAAIMGGQFKNGIEFNAQKTNNMHHE